MRSAVRFRAGQSEAAGADYLRGLEFLKADDGASNRTQQTAFRFKTIVMRDTTRGLYMDEGDQRELDEIFEVLRPYFRV